MITAVFIPILKVVLIFLIYQKKINEIKISNLGYKELTFSINRIPDTIILTPMVNKLKEINLTNKIRTLF